MDPTHRATSRDYADKYDRLTSSAAAAVRRSTLGSEIPNGYTTAVQADLLGSLLGLDGDSSLLDLGAGRGWPGSRIAAGAGCGLVSTDLPLQAVRSTRDTLRQSGLPNAVALCADGRHLPFRDRSFDAVTHADVLC